MRHPRPAPPAFGLRGVPLSASDEQSRVAVSPARGGLLPLPIFSTGEQVEERIETPLGVVLRIARRAEPTPAEPALWIA